MVISIFKFLSRYYGIALDAGVECSHKNLKNEFPFVKRCSFEKADSNPNLVGVGKIIYVVDSYNNIVPYECPEEYIIAMEECGYSVCEFEEDTMDNLLEEDLHGISTYVLKELLHKYKDKHSIYRKIKKELASRGVYQNKKHKLNREINKMEIEESDFYDKYKRRRKIKYNKS